MKPAALITACYGLLILIGGVIGHVKAASQASLAMGIIFGVLLLGCSYGLSKRRSWGIYSSLLLLIVLDAFFTFRFLKTLKFFPPGFFSLLTLLVLFSLVFLFRKKLSKKR